MKKRKFIIPAALVFIVGAVTLAGCNRHHHDPDDKAEWMVHKISKKLDLDDSQIAKLEDVKVEMMQHHKTHRDNKAEMMDKLILEVQKPKIDQAFLMEMVNQHTSRVEQVAPGVIEKLVVFHASLNSEQKEELVEKIQKFKKHHKKDDS